MTTWIAALRAPAALRTRAEEWLGAPLGVAGGVGLFALEATDPAVAARVVRALEGLGAIGGGLAALDPGATEAKALARAFADAEQRALALALAAHDGSVLLDARARAQLGVEVALARGGARDRWALPFAALRVQHAALDAAGRRALVGAVPLHPRGVARDRERSAIAAAAESHRPLALYAPRGSGGTRLFYEAAALAKRTLVRLPAAALRGDDPTVLRAAFGALPPCDWVVIDPLPPPAFGVVEAALDGLPPGRVLMVRIEGGETLPFVHATRRFAMPYLRPYDARRIARAMLGWLTDEAIVRRYAQRGGRTPRGVVEAVRGAIALGELVSAGDEWALRAERVPPPAGFDLRGDPLTARLRALSAPLREALLLCCSLGDAAPEVTVRAMLRAALPDDPRGVLAALGACGLVEFGAGSVYVSASVEAAVGALDPAALAEADALVDALAGGGVLVAAAEAEAAALQGDRHGARMAFARAASSAAEASLSAPAVRFAAAARRHLDGPVERDPTVREALGAAAGLVGHALRYSPVEAALPPQRPSAPKAPRALTPRPQRYVLAPEPVVSPPRGRAAVDAKPRAAPAPAPAPRSVARSNPPRKISAEVPASALDDVAALFSDSEPPPAPAAASASKPAPNAAAPSGKRLDAALLERVASERERQHAPRAAGRLRALADVFRGNTRRALELADEAALDGSPRARLTAALAQAAAGDLPAAVRSALYALASSRRDGDRPGEVAALAALSAVYHASGRGTEARSLADEARRRGAPG